MSENIYSGHTALSTVEIEGFGLGRDRLLPVEDENYQVNVVPPSLDLFDEQIGQLLDPMLRDFNNGKVLYLQCVQMLYSFIDNS